MVKTPAVSQKKLTAIGMMSGTSMDGIDVAVVESDGESVRPLGPSITLSYDGETRARITKALAYGARVDQKSITNGDLMALETRITELHGDAVTALLALPAMRGVRVDVIGMHGQTIHHRPTQGWTWQLGDGMRLANATGIPTVTDFRSNDMAHGGQGAPFAPLYHLARLRADRPANCLAILNIGGVSNVTWVDFSDSGAAPRLLAFDTGPGNAPLDDWALTHLGVAMDKDGALAKRGVADESCLEKLRAHPYFTQTPPKTLDRDAFDILAGVTLAPADGAATLVEAIVVSVAMAARHFPNPVEGWYVSGGGRHNPTIMRRLNAGLDAPVASVALDAPVASVEALGWYGDSIEAEAFAYLAVRAMKGLALSFPATTGVEKAVSGGVFHQPD